MAPSMVAPSWRLATTLLALLAAASYPQAAVSSILSNGCANAPSRWRSLVSSHDGATLTATDGDTVYRSTNYGAFWSVAASAGGPATANWRALACDASGSKLFGANDAGVYVSTDGAATWQLGLAFEEVDVWPTLAASSTGTTVTVGTSYQSSSSGKVFKSVASGAAGTWVDVTPSPPGTETPWDATAVSADGTTTLAGTYMQGSLYVASHGSSAWAERNPDGTNNNAWNAVSLSADGTKAVAATNNGGSFFYSSDGGATWAQSATYMPYPRAYPSLASSADGSRVVAASFAADRYLTSFSGSLYTSADAGATWTERASNTGWRAVASSADGQRLVAAPLAGGLIHRSADYGETWYACGMDMPMVMEGATVTPLPIVPAGGAASSPSPSPKPQPGNSKKGPKKDKDTKTTTGGSGRRLLLLSAASA